MLFYFKSKIYHCLSYDLLSWIRIALVLLYCGQYIAVCAIVWVSHSQLVATWRGWLQGDLGSVLYNTLASLVHRPSHRPVFDCMQKLRGNDVSVYLGRQRGEGVPHRKNELETLSCSFCPPKCWSFERLQSEKRNAPGLKRRTCMRNMFFRSGTPPPLCLPR